MKSASKMSLLIREKKKAMAMNPDVIDSGGSPSQDLQDQEIERLKQATDELNDNNPMSHSEVNDLDGHGLSPAEEMRKEMVSQPERPGDVDEKEALVKRQMRIAKMMGR